MRFPILLNALVSPFQISFKSSACKCRAALAPGSPPPALGLSLSRPRLLSGTLRQLSKEDQEA